MSPITCRVIAALAKEPLGAAELARRVHGESVYVFRVLQSLHRQGMVEFRGVHREKRRGGVSKLYGLPDWVIANREAA